MGVKKVFFSVLFFSLVTLSALLLKRPDIALWSSVGVLLILIWMYYSVVKSKAVVERGMDLLKAQELNNRLAKVGEIESDRIVSLFNKLLERLSEERLRVREQNHFLDLLIEVSPIGVAVMDFDGRISLFNDSFRELAGIATEDIKGKRPGELRGDLIKQLSELKSGETRTFRIGDRQIYRGSHLYFMEKGFRKSFLLVEKLTDEVRKAEKSAYCKIIRTISHEVNNSVAGLNMYLEILGDDISLSEEQREVAISCKERMENMSVFIGRFAEVAKLPAPEKRKVELNAMLEGMKYFLENVTMGKAELRYELCEEELMVMADRSQLEQVVVNIVKNAGESVASVSAGNPGHKGVVIVRTLKCVTPELQIEDNGAGISEKDSEKIFTPFFTTKKSGQGIGLTMATEVLTSHGFQFSLKTYNGGKTIFSIKFQ